MGKPDTIVASPYIIDDFREASDDFREVSDDFREVSDDFREVSDDFREVSDDFREVSDDFREVSDDFREVSDDFLTQQLWKQPTAESCQEYPLSPRKDSIDVSKNGSDGPRCTCGSRCRVAR